MEFTKDLYEIVEKNSDSFEVLLASKEHPIFKAHFPSFPIMPGFLLIEISLEVFGLQIKEIKTAKFVNHAFPEDRLFYTITKKDAKTKIVIKNLDQKVVSEFSFY